MAERYWKRSISIESLVFYNDIADHEGFHRKVGTIFPNKTPSRTLNEKGVETKAFRVGNQTIVSTSFGKNNATVEVHTSDDSLPDFNELLGKHFIGSWEDTTPVPETKRFAALPEGHEPPKTEEQFQAAKKKKRRFTRIGRTEEL